MNFNKNEDHIAITIPGFSLKKSAEGKFNIFKRKNNIHIATVAIDQNGQQDAKPAVYINKHSLEYKLRPWEKVTFLGDGRIIYGPGNPGSFVYIIVIFVESDKDVREFGENLEDVVKQSEFSNVLTTIASLLNPTVQIISSIISPLAKIIGRAMQKDKDNVIYTQEGVFFRDRFPPFNIGDEFTHANQHIECSFRIIPLIQETVPAVVTRSSGRAPQANQKTEKFLELEKQAGEPMKIDIKYDVNKASDGEKKTPVSEVV